MHFLMLKFKVRMQREKYVKNKFHLHHLFEITNVSAFTTALQHVKASLVCVDYTTA